MSLESGSEQRLTRTERALLRVLFAQGGACEDGHASLARAADSGERSIQRASRRLSSAGLLSIRRRGYGRMAELRLTEAGTRMARRLYAESADTPIGRSFGSASPVTLNSAGDARSADTPIRRSSSATRPDGFIGDAQALSVARITTRISHDDSPIALARAYVAQVETTPEIARIATFLDEHGMLPLHAQPTGFATLDEGLRAHFAAQARRARARERMRDLARGVQITPDE